MTTIIQYFAWFDLLILGSIAMLVLLSLYGDRTTWTRWRKCWRARWLRLKSVCAGMGFRASFSMRIF